MLRVDDLHGEAEKLGREKRWERKMSFGVSSGVRDGRVTCAIVCIYSLLIFRDNIVKKIFEMYSGALFIVFKFRMVIKF